MRTPSFFLIAALLLAGCGRNGLAMPELAADLAAYGLGAEGGEQPALVARATGALALAYVGSRVGDRHLYLRTAADGQRFGDATQVAPGDFADQAPALVEDGAGRLHLFFVSNRSGAAQAVYHVAEQGEGWSEPTPVAGLEGAQDLAAIRRPEGFLLVAEVMGAGLLAAESRDGNSWTAPTEVASAGAEPAAIVLPDGRSLIAYQAEGRILFRTCQAIGWSAPIEAVLATSRLRDPALAWGADGGMLAYTERVDGRAVLRAQHFNQELRFTDTDAPKIAAGQAHDPALAWTRAGGLALAWKLETDDGRQGISFSTL